MSSHVFRILVAFVINFDQVVDSGVIDVSDFHIVDQVSNRLQCVALSLLFLFEVVDVELDAPVDVNSVVVEVQRVLRLIITDCCLFHRVPSPVIETVIVRGAIVVSVLGHPFRVVGPCLELESGRALKQFNGRGQHLLINYYLRPLIHNKSLPSK